jgi:hypothetical protein
LNFDLKTGPATLSVRTRSEIKIQKSKFLISIPLVAIYCEYSDNPFHGSGRPKD